MNLNLFDKKGKKTEEKVKLDPGIFDCKVNKNLITQAVYVYLQNQREANASTKDRSEVRGGGRKPWRQKGTGRARHGSNRSPIWRGGGVTFGPTNLRNFKRKMNKKAKVSAMKSAFSLKNANKEIVIIEDFKPEKTKEVEAALKNLGIEGKITFIQVEEQGLNKTAKNIDNVNVVRVGELNTYNILNNSGLVIFKSALDKIIELWGEKKSPKAKKKEEIKKVVAKKKVVKKELKLKK